MNVTKNLQKRKAFENKKGMMHFKHHSSLKLQPQLQSQISKKYNFNFVEINF